MFQGGELGDMLERTACQTDAPEVEAFPFVRVASFVEFNRQEADEHVNRFYFPDFGRRLRRGEKEPGGEARLHSNLLRSHLKAGGPCHRLHKGNDEQRRCGALSPNNFGNGVRAELKLGRLAFVALP